MTSDGGHGAAETPLAGAVVTFAASGGKTSVASCPTGGSGGCSVSVSGIAKRYGTETLTVTGVALLGQTYDSDSNHDTDGDTDGTTITVPKP